MFSQAIFWPFLSLKWEIFAQFLQTKGFSTVSTACVTGAGAGVDSAWEQRQLEARKMPENAAESPTSSAPRKSGAHFSRQNVGDVLRTLC